MDTTDAVIREIQTFGLDNALQMKLPGVGAFLAQRPDETDLVRQRTYLLQLCNDNLDRSLAQFCATDLKRIPLEIKRRLGFAHLHFFYRSQDLSVAQLAEAVGLDTPAKVEKMYKRGYRLQDFFAQYPDALAATFDQTGDIAGTLSLSAFRHISRIDAILEIKEDETRHDVLFLNPVIHKKIGNTEVPSKVGDLTCKEVGVFVRFLNAGKALDYFCPQGLPGSLNEPEDVGDNPDNQKVKKNTAAKANASTDVPPAAITNKIFKKVFNSLRELEKDLRGDPNPDSLANLTGVLQYSHMLNGMIPLVDPEVLDDEF